MLGNEEKQFIFREIEKHLEEDAAPSRYFESISELPWFSLPPFNVLADLKKAKQHPKFHPEGNVWNHTMLVLDEAASVRTKSRDPKAFMWAALLHDIGKPGTTKVRRGKITSYDHDKLGAKLVTEFFNEFPREDDLAERVASLVRWHMQLLFVVKGLPFADIRSMREQADINEVALLSLCDRMGRTGAERPREEENIKIFLQKCGLR
jgi:putative nucleotidyltransferase with HDIG domain